MGSKLKYLIVLVSIIALAGLLYYANHDKPGYYRDRDAGMEFEKARVLQVLDDNTMIDETTENVRRGSMELQLEILTGEYKGDIVETTNHFSSMYNVYVTEGDSVSIRVDIADAQTYSVSVYNYDRSVLFGVIIVFFLLVYAIVGGKQGIRSIIGLIFTIICTVFLLIPLTLKGFSPIPTTILILAMTTAVCFVLLGGIQAKTVIAALASIMGVVAAAIFATIAGNVAHLSGLQMEEAESLLLIATESELSIKGLFISGVLIASLGAVMDTAMSLASSLEEIYQSNPEISEKQLIKSGMIIGRDTMGTMSNTLVLAFSGTALNLMILMYSYGVTFKQMINTDFVGIELIRCLAGTMGIVMTVPVVSILGAKIIFKHSKKRG